MTYIKKMVMRGFKSFASRTELPFENSMNVIVGPNGSGKSNITDALCFVLGKLSIKSIRAAKAANLLFSGNKSHKASPEAEVELVFDNSKKTFALETNEVSIRRIVRKNGQSIYKINNETKTRQELIEMLAQAGIDPNGFNLVLQGEIASLLKISSEERRKIVEEVAGISIYETRKTKSIKELEKTEERLKEVSAVLRERRNYLKNLEKEKLEAQNYKRLEETIKRCKSTIFLKELESRRKEIESVNEKIQVEEKEINEIKKNILNKTNEIENLEKAIIDINKKIQNSTSGEQEKLHKELSELRANLAGLEVRKENFETRIQSSKNKQGELQEKQEELKKEINKIKTSTPEIKKHENKQGELQEKLEILEKKRKRYYMIKSDLSANENKKSEVNDYLTSLKKESEIIELEIDNLANEIKQLKNIEKGEQEKKNLSEIIEKTNEEIFKAETEKIDLEKENAILETEIIKENELQNEITKLDICPLCKNKVTKQHIEDVSSNSNEKISKAEKILNENNEKISKAKEEKEEKKLKLEKLKQTLEQIKLDIETLKRAEEKKEQLKKLYHSIEINKKSFEETNNKIVQLRKEFQELENIEEQYDETRLQLQEISFEDVEDLDAETTLKQRDLNRFGIELKSLKRDIENSEEELDKINNKIKSEEKLVEQKAKEEQEVYEQFQQFFNQRNEIQDNQKAIETGVMGLQHNIRTHEDQMNNFKIEKAQVEAKFDAIKSEQQEFEKYEPLQISLEKAKEKLIASQTRLSQIGSVNLRALEVYDTVEEQCQNIEDKVETIRNEEGQVRKIIEEIDKKKRRSFMKTLDALNEYFTRNFSQLSKKGEAFLDLENKQEPFEGGLNIMIKVARGKYFDVNSLSGGEKTLIALALIFAIQEYKPYPFYVFDEIDAALDKHNSERLAGLIKLHMQGGQYIVVTHNDAIISESEILYGVSMQENISKIVSLKV